MAKKSGIESLLDALVNSGVNVDQATGKTAENAGEASAQDSNAQNNAGGSQSSGGGSSFPGGGSPFSPFGSVFGGSGGGAGFGGAKDAKGGAGGHNVPTGMPVKLPFSDVGTKGKIVLAIVALLIAALAYWWYHPPINIHSMDMWSFIAVVLLLPSYLFFSARSKSYASGEGKFEKSEPRAKKFRMFSMIPVAVILIGGVGLLLSQVFIPGNAEKYSTILTTTTGDFTEDIHEVDYSQIPVIDRESAVILGNRAMGEIPEYVSQFEISALYSQINYQESPVRVSPLGYADLFKWFANQEQGIPAYVMVNMTTQDTEIVKLEEGNGIKFSESEPLTRNIQRHIQLTHPTYMFDQFSFEVDDEGKPWWIAPVKELTVGLFGGTTIQRVVMCDASTGETQDIAVQDVPQWVDRVFPAELLMQQYNWSGAYSNGWINSWLGQQGVVQTTPGTNGQSGFNYIAKDDDVWVYSGVTSATADNSIIGFILMNQRTAESHFYSVAGATEESAMQSAEGQVQNLQYKATFPILINVGGQPTYFMALKDNAGLVKMFAMVDIQRYQNVAIGETVQECQTVYTELLATNGVIVEGDGGAGGMYAETSGEIDTIISAVVDGNTHFYITLVGEPKLYDFALPKQLAIATYEKGDSVEFKYLESDGVCEVVEILNSQVAVQFHCRIVILKRLLFLSGRFFCVLQKTRARKMKDASTHQHFE